MPELIATFFIVNALILILTSTGITLALKLVTKQFPNDPSTPGLVLSKLPNGLWYVSVVRYSRKFGKGKEVWLSATSPYFVVAVSKIAFCLYASQGVKHVQTNQSQSQTI